MTPEAWFAIAVVVVVIVAAASNRVGIDTAMVGGLIALLVGDALFGDILNLRDGLKGFAHPAVIMVGSMFVVAGGLQETGGMHAIAQRLLGRPKSTVGAQIRLMAPVTIMSAFMNNTPIVAMYLPIINDWARKLRISPSKLYMPLSFAAILGGKITLIGTASNIVVMELYLTHLGDAAPLSTRMQFWGIAALGVPTAIAGTTLVVLLSKWLLPERRTGHGRRRDSRRYQLDMIVQKDSPIIGKSIEQAGLRHLPGLYLTHIEREGRLFPAVAPGVLLMADDKLSFTGVLESVVDLRKIRGLVPATDQVEKVAALPQQRALVEAVVAHNSPLVGLSVRDSLFRTRFNAAIIAVHRSGEHVNAKIGDIVLQPGDTLLLDTDIGFVDVHRNSDDFYLIAGVDGARPVKHERSGVALAILGLLVLLLTATPIEPVVVALLCAGLMVLTRCITGNIARTSIDWQVLLVIGAALGLGAALTQTGAAQTIAAGVLGPFMIEAGETASPLRAQLALAAMFVIASLFAQLITSYGAAALMFPIAVAAAEALGVRAEPFVFTLMVAVGSTYLTPMGYQTNLMVYGPGGYHFLDYGRLGLPLTIAVAILSVVIAPLVYPFAPGP